MRANARYTVTVPMLPIAADATSSTFLAAL